MTSTHLPIYHLAIAAIISLLLSSHVNAGGYHYERPAPPAPPSPPVYHTAPHSANSGGHYFAPIPTISPLPPVPSLPVLPSRSTHIRTQTVVQLHPQALGQRSAPSAPATYQPRPFSTYTGNFPSGNAVSDGSQASNTQRNVPFAHGSPFAPAGNVASSAPSAPAAPPLRVPFGKQPAFQFPDSEFYVVNGRQLKQYAVVEFVDNDITQDTKPFLTQSFVNSYRAQVGASGTGAIAPLPSSMQLASKANEVVLQQQRSSFQGAGRRGDTIALGSGGIGFVRLPDGTISLGSGSLNFITAQQHLEDLRNARTRSESQRDPLHFGHGPLDEPNNQFLYK